jgi:drug/metabolite transporter (DMT)-like permease
MAFTKYQIILALVLVVSGTLNTISVKWMDMISSKGRDGVKRHFIHPFLQADFMFVGETLCLLAFIIAFKRLAARRNGTEDNSSLTRGSRTFKKLVLLPAALMDITATSLMYFGLSLTNASSFQMLRGSVIIFVAVLSMIILKRRILLREWIGIFLILLALVLVGLADLSQNHDGDKGSKKCTTGGGKFFSNFFFYLKFF